MPKFNVGNRTNRLLLVAVVACLAVAGLSAAKSANQTANPSHEIRGEVSKAPAVVPLDLETKDASTLVLVTKSGKKYHREGCHWAHDGRPIPLSEAAEKYTPCSICKPPKLTDTQVVMKAATPSPVEKKETQAELTPVVVQEPAPQVEPAPAPIVQEAKPQVHKSPATSCPTAKKSTPPPSRGFFFRGRR